jgi:hypothetical protein
MERLTHDNLNLVTTDDKFFLVPSDSTEVLEIDRLNFDLKLIRKDGAPTAATPKPVCLLFGIIHLISAIRQILIPPIYPAIQYVCIYI